LSEFLISSAQFPRSADSLLPMAQQCKWLAGGISAASILIPSLQAVIPKI